MQRSVSFTASQLTTTRANDAVGNTTTAATDHEFARKLGVNILTSKHTPGIPYFPIGMCFAAFLGPKKMHRSVTTKIVFPDMFPPM